MAWVEVLVETVSRSSNELNGRTFDATSCFGNMIRRDQFGKRLMSSSEEPAM
jgi:hypothetical protein